MFKAIWDYFVRSFSDPVWRYRFRYDNHHGKWLIEVSTAYDWTALHIIQNDKMQLIEFTTFEDARTHADAIGLDHVYQLDGCFNVEAKSDFRLVQATRIASPAFVRRGS